MQEIRRLSAPFSADVQFNKVFMKTYLVYKTLSPFYRPIQGNKSQPVMTLEWNNDSAAFDFCAMHADEDYDYEFIETNTVMENHYSADDIAQLGLGY